MKQVKVGSRIIAPVVAATFIIAWGCPGPRNGDNPGEPPSDSSATDVTGSGVDTAGG